MAIQRKRLSTNFFQEAEIYFKNKNYILTDLENTKFEEIIHLFKNAKLIIGIHGLELSNILFCSSNTKIIEIGPIINNCYINLGIRLGLNITPLENIIDFKDIIPYVEEKTINILTKN